MKETLRFEIVTGIKPGYDNLKPKDTDYENIASNLWQKNAKEEFKRRCIYVSAVIKRSYTVYMESLGCPKGGERTVVITGVCLEEQLNAIDLWKETVLSLAKTLRKQLGQKFMTCEFMNMEKVADENKDKVKELLSENFSRQENGTFMGKYHPHGDASVYDAMVRLAQDFSMRYMLVEIGRAHV